MRRISRLSICSLVIIGLGSCRARQESVVAEVNSNTKIMEIVAAHADEMPEEPMWVSEMINGLTSNEKYGLAETVIQTIKKYFSPIQAVNNVTPQQLLTNATALNNYPVIKLKDIPVAQQYFFNRPAVKPVEVQDFAKVDGLKFVLKESFCQQPFASNSRLRNDIDIFVSDVPVDKEIHACYHENSATLSKVLNILSENIRKETPDAVELKFPNGESVTLKLLNDFISVLQNKDYSFELFTTRTFVDFLGYTYRNQRGEYQPLIIPTWFSYAMGDKSLALPGEHSEFGMLIYRKGSPRFAQLRFYLGIPSDQYPGKVAFWRPHASKFPKWRKPLHDFVKPVEVSSADELAFWLVQAGKTLNAFQSLQTIFRLPYNSYGFFVCNDSVALMLSLVEQKQNLERISWGFPIIRAEEMTHHQSQMKINFAKMLADQVGLNYGTLVQHYPTDFSIAEADFKARIRKAFPRKSKRLKSVFPEAQKELDILVP